MSPNMKLSESKKGSFGGQERMIWLSLLDSEINFLMGWFVDVSENLAVSIFKAWHSYFDQEAEGNLTL
jgi:hypothetical protein